VQDCIASDHVDERFDVHKDLRSTEYHEAKPLAAAALKRAPGPRWKGVKGRLASAVADGNLAAAFP
jgi:hypothetical protein